MFSLDKAARPAPTNTNRPNRTIGRRVNANMMTPFSTIYLSRSPQSPHLKRRPAACYEEGVESERAAYGRDFRDANAAASVALAARHPVPTMYHFREYAVAGGLVSYGIHPSDAYPLLGVCTGPVLK